jgi:transcriptional regulator with XRE-family HTH domain
MTTEATQTGEAEQLRIGATLRAIREARGLRVGEFAKKLEISHAYLSNIENGRRALPAPMVIRAADLLGIRPIALVRPGYFAETTDDADESTGDT